MAEVNNKFNSFGYITDPQEAAKERKDAKLAKIKKEQQARSQSLFEQLQEQRKVYKEVKNAFYQAKSENHRLKERTRLYHSSEYLRKQDQDKYDASTVETKEAERTRDIELSRLQSFTDSYCSSQRQGMLISIFAD